MLCLKREVTKSRLSTTTSRCDGPRYVKESIHNKGTICIPERRPVSVSCHTNPVNLTDSLVNLVQQLCEDRLSHGLVSNALPILPTTHNLHRPLSPSHTTVDRPSILSLYKVSARFIRRESIHSLSAITLNIKTGPHFEPTTFGPKYLLFYPCFAIKTNTVYRPYFIGSDGGLSSETTCFRFRLFDMYI